VCFFCFDFDFDFVLYCSVLLCIALVWLVLPWMGREGKGHKNTTPPQIAIVAAQIMLHILQAVQKFGVRILEAFFAFFIAVMGICFIYNWGVSGDNGSEWAFD
jgi:hypothetical protein